MADKGKNFASRQPDIKGCPYSGPRHRKNTRDVTSKDIDGISDLVVWAPIKEGFIDAFSNVTYETRLRLVAEGLHNIRKAAREHELDEPFADTAKRILSLLDFRIGIVDRDIYGFDGNKDRKTLRPKKYMYLVATFDGPWEPYMRLIWDPLGTFLDLVLCNCEGYKPATHYSFEEYIEWVRQNQLDSAIFYSTSGLTVKDKIYLSELEKIQREKPTDYLSILQLNPPDPDVRARDFQDRKVGKNPINVPVVLRLGLEALNVLYKLTDYYPADKIDEARSDGRFLLRATKDLLGNFDFQKHIKPDTPLAKEFKAQIDWYSQKIPRKDLQVHTDNVFVENEIQKGLLTSYDATDDNFLVTHGVLLLMQVHDAKKTLDFFKRMRWSWEGSNDNNSQFGNEFWDKLFINLGLTFEGLKRLGVDDKHLNSFPKEFRQGLTERAPLIGDKFDNHPRRWNLPKRFGSSHTQKHRSVELSEVDFLIQARCGRFFNGSNKLDRRSNNFHMFSDVAEQIINSRTLDDPDENENRSIFEDFKNVTNKRGDFSTAGDVALDRGGDDPESDDATGIFDAVVKRIKDQAAIADPVESPLEVFIYWINVLGKFYGFSILSVENMFRPDAEPSEKSGFDTEAGSELRPQTANKDHFGFVDGISQPKSVGSRDPNPSTRLQLNHPRDVYHGDIVYGYGNTRTDTFRPGLEDTLAYNGSFMVVRKMSQDVTAFNDFMSQGVKDNPALTEEDVASLIMGRSRKGEPLINKADTDNSFNYDADNTGERCPFSSHIRLANPRSENHGRKSPMILRRGMTYGKRFEIAPDEERGVVFMAYCASLAEQYETIQRWLNAGNPSGTPSRQNDPITGIVHRDDKEVKLISAGSRLIRTHKTEKVFRAQHDGQVVHLRMPDQPFVKLEWGHYFFIPSRSKLASLCNGDFNQESLNDRINSGKEIINDIGNLNVAVQQEEWKSILEDFLTKDPTHHDITPRIWEAIENMGGVYKVESGIAFDEGRPKPTQPIILVTDEDLIKNIYKDNNNLSSAEQNSRMNKKSPTGKLVGFGEIFVNFDADQPVYQEAPNIGEARHAIEADLTSKILYKYDLNDAIKQGYQAGEKVLNRLKVAIGGRGEFKVELGRQYVQPALAEFSRHLIGIPNDHIESGNKPGWRIDAGPWDWRQGRAPVCPGDFASLSLGAFYPRPSSTITDYSYKHGPMIRAAIDKYVENFWNDPKGLDGVIANEMHGEMRKLAGDNPLHIARYKDVLARNLVGIVIGSLPPMDANLRWTLFEWLEENTLWRHQNSFHLNKDYEALVKAAYSALHDPLVRAMSIRPAPDLIYRTVRNGTYRFDNGVVANEGDMVVLCLSAATQSRIRRGLTPDVNIIFGGDRSQADHPIHACPAQKIARGGMIGILAALLDAGRIQAMPAALIVRISDY